MKVENYFFGKIDVFEKFLKDESRENPRNIKGCVGLIKCTRVLLNIYIKDLKAVVFKKILRFGTKKS